MEYQVRNFLLEKLSNLSPYSEVFTDNSKANELLVLCGIIHKQINCSKENCLGIMVMHNTRNCKDGKHYCCKVCKKTISLKKGSKFSEFTIEWKKIMRIIQCWLLNFHNYQGVFMCEVSKNTYTKMKDELVKIIISSNSLIQKIGGPGIKIQVDETAICNGRIIANPSNIYDNQPGIQWIVGGVDENDSRNFFLKLVPDRRIETLRSVFEEYVIPGTIIFTDGYPSYPQAVRLFGSEHHVVNHSQGFITSEGVHTNRIENLWSHLKQEYKARNGIIKERIPYFLKEFEWLKKNF